MVVSDGATEAGGGGEHGSEDRFARRQHALRAAFEPETGSDSDSSEETVSGSDDVLCGRSLHRSRWAADSSSAAGAESAGDRGNVYEVLEATKYRAMAKLGHDKQQCDRRIDVLKVRPSSCARHLATAHTCRAGSAGHLSA